MLTNLSYWELDTYFNNIDVTIIGSGIVGLNAALHLKRIAPTLKIIILERGHLPSGASTKNAGFACFGSPSELLADLSHNTEENVFNLVAKRWQGLQRLRTNLGDAAMDYQTHGGYEIFTNTETFTACATNLEYLNRQIANVTGHKHTYQITNERIADFGFQGVKQLIFNAAEGQIHTGNMMAAMTQKVQSLGVMILNAIELDEYQLEEQAIQIKTKQGLMFKTQQLLLAVNGFARTLLPDISVLPARSQVLITDPIPGLRIKGTFNFDEGFYYFRNIDERLLFGGGRNLNLAGEATNEFGLTTEIQAQLEHYLATMILPATSFRITTRWSGIMGLGKQDKSFIVKQLSERVYCAVRLGGMGIAVGSLVGEEAAELIYQTL